MRKLLHFPFSLFLLIMAISCCCDINGHNEGTASTVTCSVSSIDVSYEATTQQISISADCEWGISSEDISWCSVSPSGGTPGTASVQVKIAENFISKERSTNLVIRYGDEKISIPVKQGYNDLPSTSIPEGYSLVWSDEFSGGEVDPRNWDFEDWAPGWANHELQRYVPNGELAGNKTAFVEDGILNIRAMKYNGQVISARMNSTASWTYGYMEARLKLPKGRGTWPAFWMMPRDFSLGWPACGEIDIMEEVGVNPNYTSSSIHTKSYNHVMNTHKTKEILTKGAEDEFHIYAVEWTVDYLQFYTDGKAQMRFDNDGKRNNDTWPFNKEFYIILNLAWGGDWGGWNGVNESALPCTYQIDYVRVFQKLN